MLGLINNAIKCLLFLFNFIFVLTGLSLIIIGLILNSANDKIKEAVKGNEEYITAPNLLIFIGCFVFIVSFFGCCGALRESHFMIFIFSVLMAAIFVAELSVGVAGYTMRSEASEVVATSLNDSIKKYLSDNQTKDSWDELQSKLLCCGSKNYSDWGSVFTQPSLPLSCCEQPSKVCTYTSPSLHKTPCFEVISNIIHDNLSTIGLTTIIIALIQLLGVVFSCHLAYSIRKDYETV